MVIKEFQEVPLWRIRDWFKDLTERQFQDLKLFHVELLRFCRTVNLISTRTIVKSDSIHFADSILAGRMILAKTNSEVIYDIGSGNGFPGLVMAILDRKRKIVFVESDSRKAEFLKHMCARVELEKTSIIVQRVENLPENSIPAGVSRAFAPLTKSLMVTRKVFIKGAPYFQLKATEWSTELASLPHQLCSTWNTQVVGEYNVPEDTEFRTVLVSYKE